MANDASMADERSNTPDASDDALAEADALTGTGQPDRSAGDVAVSQSDADALDAVPADAGLNALDGTLAPESSTSDSGDATWDAYQAEAEAGPVAPQCTAAPAAAACSSFVASESPSKHDIAAFVSAVDGARHVVYRDSTGNVIDAKTNAGSWSTVQNLTQITSVPKATGSIAAWSWPSAGADQIAYLAGTDVILLTNAGSRWASQTLTTQTGAAHAAVSSPITGFAAVGVECVGYVSSDGHVWLLSASTSDAGPSWSVMDATGGADAPLVASGAPLSGFASPYFGYTELAYISADGHVHTLGSGIPVTSAIADTDLTSATGAAATVTDSLVAYTFESGQTMQVVYTTGDGHIHEMAFPGGAWMHHDLTTLAHGAPAGTASQLAAYSWDAKATKQVDFTSADFHVHELSDLAAGWQDLDLTAAASAPIAATGVASALGPTGPFVAFTAPDGKARVLEFGVGWTVSDIASGADSQW